MNKTLTLLATAAILGTSTIAAADNKTSYEAKVEYKKDSEGNMVRVEQEKAINAAGTAIKNKVETEVDVKDDGSVEKVVTSKSVTDPKGLMNKKVTETKEKVEYDA